MPIFECSRCNEMTYSASAGITYTCARCGSSAVRMLEGAFDQARNSVRHLGPADHGALVYGDPAEVASFCVRFLTEGVRDREHVVASLPGDLDPFVRGLLDEDVLAAVDWRESEELYGDFNADRAAATYDAMVENDGRPTRILAGIDSVEGVDVEEFDRYERMAHRIVTDHRVNALCLYDTRILPPEFVAAAARRHGLLVSEAGARRNEQFEYVPA